MQEKPTLNEIVGSVITIFAVLTVMYLAANGDDGSKTALITLTGAAAGMYYQNKAHNMNRIASSKTNLTAPKPVAASKAEVAK